MKKCCCVKKALSLAVVILAFSCVGLASFAENAAVQTILGFIMRACNLMLPILIIGALIKFILMGCFCPCVKAQDDEGKCCQRDA